MAAFTDILHRLERTLHRDRRIHAEAIYRPQPLPGWLAGPWADVRHNCAAENLAPVLVVNQPGANAVDTVCIVRLADLVRLSQAHAINTLIDEAEGALQSAGELQHQLATDYIELYELLNSIFEHDHRRFTDG